MQTLYVSDRDTEIARRGERIVLVREGRVEKDVPLARVDNVVIFGNATLTPPAVQLLIETGIPVSFVSFSGRFRARLTPPLHKGALLRRAQYSAHIDPEAKLGLAREFVRGKLANCRVRLLRAARDRRKAGELDEAKAISRCADELSRLLASIDSVSHLDALRGLEGIGSRAYFSGLRRHLRADGMAFERRTRRPPKDPVNALLSLAYVMLMGHIGAFVEVAGLDPYLGFLHELRHGKPCLTLDLMEEFRPSFADALVTALVNRRQLQPHHFEERQGGVELTEAGRRIFLKAFEERLRETILHPILGENVSWRRAFEVQVRLAARAILGEIPSYVPLVVR